MKSCGGALALHVRELLRHFAVAHAEEIDPADISAAPVIPPADSTTITARSDLLCLELCLWRFGKKSLPERSYVRLAHEPFAVWNRRGVLENHVIRHQRHHGVNIMSVKRLIESHNDLFGVVRLTHPAPRHRLADSPTRRLLLDSSTHLSRVLPLQPCESPA